MWPNIQLVDITPEGQGNAELAQVRHGVCIFGDFGPSWGCKQLFLQAAESQDAM